MFFLLLLASSLACETQIAFGYSSCVFYVAYPNASQCSSFTFNKCTWSQCGHYSYDSDGRSDCDYYVTRENHDWNYCTNQCCEEDVTYPQTSDAIKQCQEHLDNNFKTGLIIGLSVFGGFLLIFLTCVCCCTRCCNRCQNCCCCCQDCFDDCCPVFCQSLCFILTCGCCRRISEEEPAIGEVVGQAKEIEMQNTAMYLQPMWRFESIAHTRLGNVCSVCLDDKLSLQLQCGHVFHRKCIIACLRKKQECILCRTNSFNQVKVYCENCFAAHYQTTLLEHMALLDNNRQFCDGCQEAGYIA